MDYTVKKKCAKIIIFGFQYCTVYLNLDTSPTKNTLVLGYVIF